jgi:hypothetical protein
MTGGERSTILWATSIVYFGLKNEMGEGLLGNVAESIVKRRNAE